MAADRPLIPASPTREDYLAQALANADESVFEETDPLALFSRWLSDARQSELNDANAMSLATVDAQGAPDARIVLLKDADERGFAFYTNLESAKGRQLAAEPRAALLFHWKTLRRQVRIRGVAEPVGAEEADAYFATRAPDSRIGAWASDQSRPLENREQLEARVAQARERFGEAPPRPPHWSGWRVKPEVYEFWRDRPFRLHDRLVFERTTDGWRSGRLYP